MKAFIACLISFPDTSSPIYFPTFLPEHPSLLLNISHAFTTNPSRMQLVASEWWVNCADEWTLKQERAKRPAALY